MSAAATKKNLKVARCDGVVFSPVSGSVLGTSPCSVGRVCEPKYQTMPPTPASSSTKLMTLQTTEPPVTLFPTRGSCGQFCVYETVWPDRFVEAAHEVHQKKAAISRAFAASVCAPRGMAYSSRPAANTSE